MDAPVDYSIDDLASRTIIKEYGDITFVIPPSASTFHPADIQPGSSMVTIPGCSMLPESERAAVFAQAQLQQMLGCDGSSLSSRLRCLTPPLDEDEEAELSKSLELDARLALERDGCPPCYPSGLEIPLHRPPEKYKAIVQYWQSFPQTDDMVLRAQLSNWRAFRASQRNIRRGFRDNSFSKFVDAVRDRLQKHGINEQVNLGLDLEKQTHLQTWIEYLHHNLKRMEQFEKRRDRLKKELSGTIKAEDMKTVLDELGIAERDLERHKVLLIWVEEERRTMAAKAKTITRGKNNQSTISRTARRTSARRTSATMGQVEASRSMPNIRKRQHRKPTTAENELTTRDREGVPRSSGTQTLKHQSAGHTHPKETSANYQRRLPKDHVTHLRSGTQRGTLPQADPVRSGRRKEQGRLEHPCEHFRTRSGRISKPPTRWVPR
ncbi:hypothetical protein C2857_000165 [Epichloe festucae Fl1]|uniref:Uncharacterized protein n=1 Tax=Epichloe festucae (strain Fl1) TaxID=877507 RepID=A0A7S9KMZ5_EPIFF|nr:hypothetical protein C2857_000165 [Epichloe festucae Fl1]